MAVLAAIQLQLKRRPRPHDAVDAHIHRLGTRVVAPGGDGLDRVLLLQAPGLARRQLDQPALEYLGRGVAAGLDRVHRTVDGQPLRLCGSAAQRQCQAQRAAQGQPGRCQRQCCSAVKWRTDPPCRQHGLIALLDQAAAALADQAAHVRAGVMRPLRQGLEAQPGVAYQERSYRKLGAQALGHRVQRLQAQRRCLLGRHQSDGLGQRPHQPTGQAGVGGAQAGQVVADTGRALAGFQQAGGMVHIGRQRGHQRARHLHHPGFQCQRVQAGQSPVLEAVAVKTAAACLGNMAANRGDRGGVDQQFDGFDPATSIAGGVFGSVHLKSALSAMVVPI